MPTIIRGQTITHVLTEDDLRAEYAEILTGCLGMPIIGFYQVGTSPARYYVDLGVDQDDDYHAVRVDLGSYETMSNPRTWQGLCFEYYQTYHPLLSGAAWDDVMELLTHVVECVPSLADVR